MRYGMRVFIVTLVAAAAFPWAASAQAPGRAPEKPVVPSVPAPEGWKTCPRCQNETDRREASARAKVEGHASNPRDLSGVWYGGEGAAGRIFTNPPPYTPLGKERFEATIGDKNAAGEYLHTKDTSGIGGGAQVNCDPRGWPRLATGNYGFEFIMLPDRVLQFFEQTHTWRTIWTDGRKLPDSPPELRWLGWNVGRWEGNTFVVESTGFDDRSWISATQPDGGFPHSDEMRVVERWRRLNYGTIEVQITITDRQVYSQPWALRPLTVSLAPGTEIWEYFCVPSDFNTFNNDIYLPVATGDKK